MTESAVVWGLAVVLAVAAHAQAPSIVPPPGRPGAATVAAPELAQALAQLEQASQAALVDLAALRIDKWKGDSREQGRQYAQSLQQNMVAALPGMISAVRAAPENLHANFKLYRNLNVLYEVFAGLTELAGAYGPKDDYRALAADLQSLDAARRALADRMESLTQAKDVELTRLRSQARSQPAAAAPPKRIVVDDNEPPKKKPKKPAANQP